MDLDADDLREIIQQNRKLLQTHKRHKRVIEGQIAGFGKLHAPSHLLLQESDLDEQIQECESNIEAVINKILHFVVISAQILHVLS